MSGSRQSSWQRKSFALFNEGRKVGDTAICSWVQSCTGKSTCQFFRVFFRHICRIAICRHPDSLLLFLDFGQGHNIFPSLTTYCSLQRNLITSLNFATMIVTTFYFFCTRNIEAIRNVLNKDIYYSYMQCLNGLLMGWWTGSFENEALENEDRSTKHPKLENEAPKTRKRSTQISKTKHPKLENEAPKSRKRRPLNLENEAP